MPIRIQTRVVSADQIQRELRREFTLPQTLIEPARHGHAFQVVRAWAAAPENRDFVSMRHLATEVHARVLSSRLNHFFGAPGENENIAPVHQGIRATVASNTDFGSSAIYGELSDARLTAMPGDHPAAPAVNAILKLMRQAEEEYILMGINKSTLNALSLNAVVHQTCIAVRPTGVLAHMPFEVGNPTKPQEFKNKTSKDEDLWLCDELDLAEVGAVVHYDPSAPWHFGPPASLTYPLFNDRAGMLALKWENKKRWIESLETRNKRRSDMLQRKFGQRVPLDWEPVRRLFVDRYHEVKEFGPKYRFLGAYAREALVRGPYLRLRSRPDENLFGDHDIFGYGRWFGGGIRLTDEHTAAQTALQMSTRFQAQHGGVWTWNPVDPVDQGIRHVIMRSHGPGGKPLVCAKEDGRLMVCFFYPERHELRSVWDADEPSGMLWLQMTPSGKTLRWNTLRGAIVQATQRRVPHNTPDRGPAMALMTPMLAPAGGGRASIPPLRANPPP